MVVVVGLGRARPAPPHAQRPRLTPIGNLLARLYWAEVERIVGERRRYHGRTAVMEYEVKWRGYPAEENTWETIDAILDETVVDKFHLHRDITKVKAKMLKGMATIPQDPRFVESGSSGQSGPFSHPSMALSAPASTASPADKDFGSAKAGTGDASRR